MSTHKFKYNRVRATGVTGIYKDKNIEVDIGATSRT